MHNPNKYPERFALAYRPRYAGDALGPYAFPSTKYLAILKKPTAAQATEG